MRLNFKKKAEWRIGIYLHKKKNEKARFIFGWHEISAFLVSLVAGSLSLSGFPTVVLLLKMLSLIFMLIEAL